MLSANMYHTYPEQETTTTTMTLSDPDQILTRPHTESVEYGWVIPLRRANAA